MTIKKMHLSNKGITCKYLFSFGLHPMCAFIQFMIENKLSINIRKGIKDVKKFAMREGKFM